MRFIYSVIERGPGPSFVSILNVLLLTVIVLAPSRATAQQIQTINISTGVVGQSGTATIAPLQLDDDWQVTADPLNPTLPRAAIVVDNLTNSTHIKWPVAFTNSQWISPASNKYFGSLQPPRTSFTYKTCFGLPAFYVAPALTMQLRSDDIVRQVRLNGTTIVFNDTDPNAAASAAKAGSHLGPPLLLAYSSATGFHGGQNCIEVVVEDVQQFITGLDVIGAVTYQSVLAVTDCRRRFPPTTIAFDLSTGTQGNPPADVAAGSADPKWFLVSSPLSAGSSSSYVTDPSGVWYILNSAQPANWIQRKQNASPQLDDPGSYTYRVQFGLNLSLYNSVQLSFRYAADNAAVVKLNGATIASCGGNSCFMPAGANWASMTTVNSGFLSVNTLDVVVANNSPINDKSETGLIVDATLRADCKPQTAIPPILPKR